jgi:hypothetical protein
MSSRDLKDGIFGEESFALIGELLAEGMSGLSGVARWLYVLFLLRVVRKRHSREFTIRSNPFKLTYQDFIKYGIAESSFKAGVNELIENEYILVTGKYGKKRCRLLKW